MRHRRQMQCRHWSIRRSRRRRSRHSQTLRACRCRAGGCSSRSDPPPLCRWRRHKRRGFRTAPASAEESGSAKPIASETQAIVLAVNCPPHAPSPGQACFSRSQRSSADILPAAMRADAFEQILDSDVAAASQRPAGSSRHTKTRSAHSGAASPSSCRAGDLSQPARPTSAS